MLALRGTLGSALGASTFQIPADQRYYAGGSATVRGYRFQAVGPLFPNQRPTGGSSLTAATVEYRQRFGESFGAAVFVDAAQIGHSSAPFTGNLFEGVGVGARYYTSLGPIRFRHRDTLGKAPQGRTARGLYRIGASLLMRTVLRILGWVVGVLVLVPVFAVLAAIPAPQHRSGPPPGGAAGRAAHRRPGGDRRAGRALSGRAAAGACRGARCARRPGCCWMT